MAYTVDQLHKVCKPNRLDGPLDTRWADEAEAKSKAVTHAKKAKPARPKAKANKKLVLADA